VLNMEAVRSSEMLVTTCHATRWHNPKDYNLNSIFIRASV
jgi:hypothetical protein